MEWIEARALKSSFLSEITMNISTSQQVRFDDVRCLAASVTCDDFSVDDLFDFSDKYFEDGSFQESEEDEVKDSFSLSCQQQSFSSKEKEFEPQLPEHELSAVPVDEMENLEWLSQIVDDSRTEISLVCPLGNLKAKTGNVLENRCEPVAAAVHIVSEPRFPLPATRKPRGKRSRRFGRVVWTYGSPSVTTSSSTSYSSNGSSMVSPFSVEESQLFSSGEKLPPTKKQKKKPMEETGGSLTLRRCSHCQVQKTPQWRSGPMGPKTLCNACGVRYKSGRLFPEYRPACSPTFSQEIHSNSHRKVLEIRLKKDTDEPFQADVTSMVLSF